MALVELARFYNSFEAGVVQSRLLADGIESVIFDNEMSWEGLGGLIPIRLMVIDEDLAAATAVLEAEED
ncbi:MAG TPA: DUF2007 domain-containing protein [Allosphingosinicella sp.]